MKKYDIDFTPGGIPPIVHCSQGDNIRSIIFNTYLDGSRYSIPDGAIVYIQGKKPDGHGFIYDSNSNVISFDTDGIVLNLTDQMTACPGRVVCEFKDTRSSNAYVIHTANFIIDVEESALPSDAEMSDSDYALIEKAVNLAPDILEVASMIEYVIAKDPDTGKPVMYHYEEVE